METIMQIKDIQLIGRPDVQITIDYELATLLYQVANYGGFTERWPIFKDLRFELRKCGINYDTKLFAEVIQVIRNKNASSN